MKKLEKMARVFLSICLLTSLIIGTLPAQPVRAASNGLVISQVYGAGGNSGATYNSDFIELFNGSTEEINLAEYSVQYASATGTSWQATPLVGIIQPGSFFLIRESINLSSTAKAIPSPDFVGDMTMSASVGKVALRHSTTPFTATEDPISGSVDFVAYGTTASPYEVTRAPAPGATTSIIRLTPCVDKDNNGVDFSIGQLGGTTPVLPRNSSTPAQLCAVDIAPTVIGTDPATDATGVTSTPTVTVTFSEPVTVLASGVSAACGGNPVVTTAANQTTALKTYSFGFVDPLPAGTTCTVTLAAASVTDVDTPLHSLAADYSWSFTTIAADAAPVVSSVSPINGAAGIAVNTLFTVNTAAPANFSPALFTVNCADGLTYLPTTTDPTTDVASLSFTTDPVLPYNKTCTVTLPAASITNSAAISMAADYQWSFTTAYQSAPPAITSVFPTAGATKVTFEPQFEVTFDRDVSIAFDQVSASCGAKVIAVGAVDQTTPLNVAKFTLAEPLLAGTSCTVKFPATSVTGTADGQPMSVDYAWSFATTRCGDPLAVPIPAIQGNTFVAAKAGQTVSTYGVVTARFAGVTIDGVYDGQLVGYFMQDPVGDGDSATSDGLFVYHKDAPVNVGDWVAITSPVTDYLSGSTNYGQMYNTTQLSGTATNYEICSTGNVIEPTPVTLPLTLEQFEAHEGMLLTFNNLTVEQNYFQARFGQVTLGNGRLFTPTNGQPVPAEGNLANMVVLDDCTNRNNVPKTYLYPYDGALRAGDTIPTITGVLDQGRINADSTTTGVIAKFPTVHYRIQATQPVVPQTTNPRPNNSEIVDLAGQVKVSGFNVLNYFTTLDMVPYRSTFPYDGSANTPRGADTQLELDRQEAKIISALSAINADVFGLTEIESWDGANALQTLVDKLNAAVGAGTYAAIADPEGFPQPGLGGDYIQVAIIYKPGKVTPVGLAQTDLNSVFSRAPIAQTFTVNATGETFSVVVNHFKSKGSCPDISIDPANIDTGEGCWSTLRSEQAAQLLKFIEVIKTNSADPDVLAIGDYNAYGTESPINVLTTGGMVNEMAAFVPEGSRYSYVFDGQAGYLDHGLATAELSAQVGDAMFWHINADEPSLIDYVTDYKGGTSSIDLYQPHEFRSSDHDPVIVGLFPAAPVLEDPGPLEVRLTRNILAPLPVSDADDAFSSLTLTLNNANVPGAFITGGNQFSWTPPLDTALGDHTFTLEVCDNSPVPLCTTKEYTITVLESPIPVALDQSLTVVEDTPLDITLTARSLDVAHLRFTPVDLPDHGQLTGTAPNLIYTPDLNYFGTDSFTFRASDTNGTSNIATITIEVTAVNDAPVANPLILTLDEDKEITIHGSGTDVENDALVYEFPPRSEHGTITRSGSDYVYKPDANYNGNDSFTYRAYDGQDFSAPALVTVIINPINDAPTGESFSVTVSQTEPSTITLRGDDVDGDTLQYIPVALPQHGDLTGVAPDLLYTPDSTFSGTDSFSYNVSDGKLISGPYTVTITVQEVNDRPILNLIGDKTVNELGNLNFYLTASDIDLPAQVLTFNAVGLPAGATLDRLTGQFKWKPTEAQGPGNYEVTFWVCDSGEPQLCSVVQTINITVAEVNLAPSAAPKQVTVSRTDATVIPLVGTDPDLPAQTLTFSIAKAPKTGTVVIKESEATFVPNQPIKQLGDSFQYTVCDSGTPQKCATATVTLVYNAVLGVEQGTIFLPFITR